MPFPSGQALTRWKASFRATAAIRSMASVSASGSGENSNSTVSEIKSNGFGVGGMEGVRATVVGVSD